MIDNDALLMDEPTTGPSTPLGDHEAYERLTERERSVFRYIARGYSAPEIGDRLAISPKTVDTYKQRIHEKIHLSHRSQYVQLALRLGLLASDSPGRAPSLVGR